jgi:hypothetical protein
METDNATSDAKLTPNQEAALLALLSHGSVAKAAVACGLSEATLWRSRSLNRSKRFTRPPARSW